MPPVPTSSDPIGGELSIEINGVVIPSFMLGPISPNVAQLLRTSERQSGTTSRPSNRLDNPSYDVTFFPNAWADIGHFMPDNLDGSSFVLGGSDCTTQTPVPVVFHYECDENEARDVNLPSALVSFEDNTERNGTEDVSVTIHIYPQPNALGQVVYGPMPTS